MARPQMGWTIWFTGLPAAGKTTLAYAIQQRLADLGILCVVLDSDEVRRVLLPNAGYSEPERDAFYTSLVELAALIARNGVNVLIAATGHRRAYRQAARTRLTPFAEVWVRCPPEVCRARDPKQLYARAGTGDVAALPGANVPYEPPDASDITVDTDQQDIDEAAATVLGGIPFLRDNVKREA